MLFGCGQFLTSWSCGRSKHNSMAPIREPLMFDIKSGSSASEGLKSAGSKSLKGKVNPAFLFMQYCITLLRHCVMNGSWSCQGESGRFAGLAASLMEYVIYFYTYVLGWLVV